MDSKIEYDHEMPRRRLRIARFMLKLRHRLSGIPAGELRSTHHVTVSDAATATDEVAVEITFAPDRPWQERWRTVMRELQDLEDAYAGTLAPPADWADVPVEFCEDCYHLKDWIKNDAVRAPATAQNEADRYAHNSEAIALTGDVANTYKHRTRKPRETTARVTRIQLNDGGARFTIEWTSADGATGTRDALDLARTAVRDWRQFFASHGMDEHAA